MVDFDMCKGYGETSQSQLLKNKFKYYLPTNKSFHHHIISASKVLDQISHTAALSFLPLLGNPLNTHSKKPRIIFIAWFRNLEFGFTPLLLGDIYSAKDDAWGNLCMVIVHIWKIQEHG